MHATKFRTSRPQVSDQQIYEQDARTLAVDTYTNSHLITASNTPYHEALEHAYNNSIANGLDDIAVSTSQGKYLAIQTKLIGAQHVLEIGTLGAYSSIWFASAGPTVHVTSIEVNAFNKSIAEQNIQHAGLGDRIEVHLGAALDVLPGLLKEIKAGTRPRFDMVFIDADKANNLSYFNLAMQMVRGPGACIYIDNVVRKARLVDQAMIEAQEPNIMGTRAAIEAVGRDDRVEAVVVQTVSEKNYDGFLLAVVK